MVVASSTVIAATDLAYYSGDDGYTLPLMSVGGVGVVGTSTHFTGARTKAMLERFLAGDLAGAVTENAALLPVYTGVFATQGCILVKAGLAARGFGPAVLRSPMIEATPEQARTFVGLLDAAGL